MYNKFYYSLFLASIVLVQISCSAAIPGPQPALVTGPAEAPAYYEDDGLELLNPFPNPFRGFFSFITGDEGVIEIEKEHHSGDPAEVLEKPALTRLSDWFFGPTDPDAPTAFFSPAEPEPGAMPYEEGGIFKNFFPKCGDEVDLEVGRHNVSDPLKKEKFDAPSMRDFVTHLFTGSEDEEFSSTTDFTVYGLASEGIKKKKDPSVLNSTSEIIYAVAEGVTEYGPGGFANVLLKKGSEAVVGEAAEKITTQLINPALDRIDRKIAEFTPAEGEVDKNIKKYLLLGSGAVVGTFAAWYILNFFYGRIQDYLTRPHLDYTKRSFDPTESSMYSKFRDMVFSPEGRNRLNSLMMSTERMVTAKLQEHDDVPFRNIVFSGPHGSGKHLFAQELARFARMNFFEIKSSSLVKFKNNEAAVALGDFFKEIGRSSRPAIIYIDNAAVLFSKYVADNPSDIGRMIRLFVEKTEKRSNKFMMILGVTEKPAFDSDMSSVIDDVIEFERPGFDERKKILETYRDKLFLTAKDVKPEFAALALQYLNDDKIRSLAENLDKFVAADIVSFMKALKDESKLTKSWDLSESLINRVLERTISKYVNNLIPAA